MINESIYSGNPVQTTDRPTGFETVEAAQNSIYNFFIKVASHQEPQVVLTEFEGLFFHLSCTDENSNICDALIYLMDEGGQSTFNATFKRVCYILINNWYISRQQQFTHHLFHQLDREQADDSVSLNANVNRLRNWLIGFLTTSDYAEIKQCALTDRGSWSSRYTSYLLVPQFNDPTVSEEQQEFARSLSQQLKDRYKFDLAMYIARSQSSIATVDKDANPTQLGDEVLNLIKRTISTQRLSNYRKQAQEFLKETQRLKYSEFKQRLPEYLMVNVSNQQPIKVLRDRVNTCLNSLYSFQDNNPCNRGLTLRTCNRLVGIMITEDGKTPSDVFNAFIARSNALTLVIILLKVVLISSSTRTHLELCVSQVIQYYEDFEEERCKPLIYFLEVFNLVFTIFTENTQYDLVRVGEEEASNTTLLPEPETCRLFAQSKGIDLRGADLKGINIRSIDLQGSDLRDSDLRGIDLVGINLRLANLAGANLSGVDLNEAQLSIANLNQANLNETSLIGADLRRADLQRANIARTNLESAKLDRAEMYQANLSHSNLSATSLEQASLYQANLYHSTLHRANFRQADLSEANLSYADLRGADLEGANLTGANLSGADLSSTNLKHAKLHQANLSNVNLYRADLSHADLEEASLVEANLNWTNLSQTNLRRANLASAVLRHAILTGSDLEWAVVRHTDLTRANLSQANLTSTNLTWAQIRHTDLSKARLIGTNLKDANLFGSNLIEADIQGAKFGNNSGLSDQMKQDLQLD